MKKCALFVAIGACAGSVNAQESLTVFGIPFNSSTLPAECAVEEPNSWVRNAEALGKTYKGGFPQDAPCFKRRYPRIGTAVPLHDETVLFYFPLGREPALGETLAARFVDGRIQRLWLDTGGVATQQQDFSALQAKFGKPTSLRQEPAQNMAGAAFDVIHADWSVPGGVTVRFRGAGETFHIGLVVIATEAGERSYQPKVQPTEL